MSSSPLSCRALVLLAVGALGLAACGGGDDDHGHGGASDVTAAPDAVVIEVDADSGTAVTETVPVGSDVSIRITSSEEHEFHVHGYDIVQTGTEVTFNFTADEAGEFEVETHDTDELVLTLVVEG